MRLLARCGKLTSATALHIAQNAPECFQGDIVGIVAMVEDGNNWAVRYLDGAKQDALQAVVIDGVRAKVSRENKAG
jgi:ABC-type sugar transport system ATPase subunit